MIDLSQARMTQCIIHQVGNKLKQEGYRLSDKLIPHVEEKYDILTDFFLSGFKQDEFFKFTNLESNPLYSAVKDLIDDPKYLPSFSTAIARLLYEAAMHPHIKSGDLYIAHFRECVVNEVTLDAIGIFKAEVKDTFIHAHGANPDGAEVDILRGNHVKKLDKGCLIFNTFSEDGYSVLMVDRNSEDTAYWRDDFLGVERIQDESFQTQHFLNMAKDFCDEVLASEKNKKEQLVFLNRSINYFSKKAELDLDEFKANVVEPHHRKKFEEYRNDYELETGIPSSEEGFRISKIAVRQMKKEFKSVMDLDTGIRIHLLTKDASEAGQWVERGFDAERNMYYYKTYFNAEES